MPLVPSNVNFQIGDILTATQYNETHNTTAKLALEDNSRIVLPSSSAPTNIANGHWVLGAIAGDYINFNGVGNISTPSVLLYEYSTDTWLVYPLNSAVVNDTTLTSYYTYSSYTANQDFVYFVNTESTTASYRVPFIYKCILSASPTQSPESYPSKWTRAGVYINESTIISLSNDVQTLSQSVGNLTLRVIDTEISITDLINENTTINLRIDSIENLITTLGIDQINNDLAALSSSITVLEGRVTETESNITSLDNNFNELSTTLLGGITALTSRVGIVEGSVTVLQNDMLTLDQNMAVIGQEFDVVKTTVENFPLQIEALDIRVDTAEININNLGSDLTALTDSVNGTDALLSNTIVRVATSEVDILELQGALANKAELLHDHSLTYEPKNSNIQAHISDSTIHFIQADIVISKDQIPDLGTFIEVETDPIFTASQASLVTADHITVLNNTTGVNTGDQDLSNLSPLVHAHVEADITDLDKYTKTEVNGLLDTKANAFHTHVEADITDLDKYTKAEVDFIVQSIGGDLTEAPLDGKQYARQDGIWAEVVTGSTDVITTDTVEVYNPDKPNDENGFAYYSGNTFVSYVNGDSLDPQFTTESLYRCYSNAYIGETPETNPDKWVYQGSSVVVTNDNTGITVVRSNIDLKAITGYKHDDSVISLDNGAVYFYDSLSNLGEVPNDNTTGLGSWVNTPTNNVFETVKPLLNTSGSICTVIVGREIIHTLPEGTTTLNVVSSFGAGYTKVEKTYVIFDNTDNTSDVAVTWPTNTGEYWTDNKPSYINAGSIIKLEVLIYGSAVAIFNPYFIQTTGSSSWTTVYIDSAVTTSFDAVPYTTYLVDGTTAGVTALLPNSTSGDTSEYKFLLNKDTHKLTVTTVGGTQLIGGYTSLIIPTLKGSVEVKSNESGYDVTDDNRSTINVVDVTTNRDFGDDNFENNFLYLVNPAGGSLALTLPTATNIAGGIAIRSRFQLEGTGDFSITCATGTIGDSQSQTVNVEGTGFDIVWYNSKYYIQNDTRPKTTSATVTTYPMNEDSTITDTVTGTFFKQRCASTECPGFDPVNSTLSNTTITAAAGSAYQCTSSSLVAGSMIGSIPVGNIEIYYNTYKTGAVNIEVYVEYSRRTVAGVETVIGTSAIGTVTSTTLTQLRLVAQHIAFDILETDYLVVRTYARKATTGTDPVLHVTVEGSNATRSAMEIGASSIAHGTLAGRGAANSHPANAIQLASGTNLEVYLAANNPTPDIVSATAWDGTSYNIDLEAGDITWKAVNDLVTSLTVGITFASDAITKSRVATLIIDNSANTVAITTITFNGNWYWPLGVQPLGLAAGAVAVLQVRNIAGTIVLPTYFIKA